MPGVELDFLSSRVFDIKEDAEHHIWIATNYEGIVRLDLQDKTQAVCGRTKAGCAEYLLPAGRFPSADMGRLYVERTFLL